MLLIGSRASGNRYIAGSSDKGGDCARALLSSDAEAADALGDWKRRLKEETYGDSGAMPDSFASSRQAREERQRGQSTSRLRGRDSSRSALKRSSSFGSFRPQATRGQLEQASVSDVAQSGYLVKIALFEQFAADLNLPLDSGENIDMPMVDYLDQIRTWTTRPDCRQLGAGEIRTSGATGPSVSRRSAGPSRVGKKLSPTTTRAPMPWIFAALIASQMVQRVGGSSRPHHDVPLLPSPGGSYGFEGGGFVSTDPSVQFLGDQPASVEPRGVVKASPQRLKSDVGQHGSLESWHLPRPPEVGRPSPVPLQDDLPGHQEVFRERPGVLWCAECEVCDVPSEAWRAQQRPPTHAQVAGGGETKMEMGGGLEHETLRGPRPSATGRRKGVARSAAPSGGGGQRVGQGVPRRFAAPACRRLACFEGRKVVELVSGSARLARSIAQQGIDCEAWDIIDGPGADLLALRNRKRLLQETRRGRVLFIWMCFPCTSWSMARRLTHSGPGPLRDGGAGLWGLPGLSERDEAKAAIGNRLLRVTASIAKEPIRLRILLWKIRNLLAHGSQSPCGIYSEKGPNSTNRTIASLKNLGGKRPLFYVIWPRCFNMFFEIVRANSVSVPPLVVSIYNLTA